MVIPGSVGSCTLFGTGVLTNLYGLLDLLLLSTIFYLRQVSCLLLFSMDVGSRSIYFIIMNMGLESNLRFLKLKSIFDSYLSFPFDRTQRFMEAQ